MVKIIDFFKNVDEKSSKLFKHIGLSAIFKIGTISINLILVPLSISYLGSAKYGLWLTLFSFIGWFSIADFGVGNGLRNKLSHALATGDLKLAKEYTSTAYSIIILISIVLFLLFMVVFPLVDWSLVFNFDDSDQSVKKLIFISFVIFSISLTLKNINVIYYADQKSSLPELFNFVSQLVTLLAVYFIMSMKQESLFVYGIIILFSQLTILVLSTLLSFFGKYNAIMPSIKYYNKNYVKDIFSIGIKFFILQISSILITSTDTYIINLYLGSSEVTVYTIPSKYFMLCVMVVTTIATPYWSAFTQAYSQNNNLWMKKSIKMLIKISISIAILIIFMIIVSDKVYSLWLGDLVKVPFLLTLIIGLNTIIRVFIYPVVMFLNGVGKIQIELYLGIVLAVINIPLSIYLAVNLKLGISGVVLATLLITIIELMVLPIQVKKIIDKKANGIWNM